MGGTGADHVRQEAERLAEDNLARVLHAFRTVRLSAPDLEGARGYGYGDVGRDKLDRAYAALMGTEQALVRPQWASGTSALAAMVRAVGRFGTKIVTVGPVYDTLAPLLDPDGRHPQSLVRGGAAVTAVPLAGDVPNPEALRRALAADPDWIYLQRSRGYQRRPSWSPEFLRSLIAEAHRAGALVMVDNCYGEFTDRSEPGAWGADLLAGSLLKNPGGGLAETGGYVAGRGRWVERVGDELNAPGVGGDLGPTGPYLRGFWQGLFYAPHAVSEALIGTAAAADLLAAGGLRVDPPAGAWPRHDIILAVEMPDPDTLLRAVRAVQAVSPVDGHAVPEPWAMPGYRDPVVMAQGGFVPGGSLELSADAPMRPPWTLYLQGGVMRQHTVLAAKAILQAIQA
jgi:cystathionine beta-lyase family protein involved in aluminum resistance